MEAVSGGGGRETAHEKAKPETPLAFSSGARIRRPQARAFTFLRVTVRLPPFIRVIGAY